MNALASLRLTLPALLALTAGVAAYAAVAQPSVSWVVAPLALLAANLGAAIVVNGAFRRNAPLLVFHLALLAIVLLAGAGRLTFLKGQLELAEGEEFEGTLASYEAGPLHRGDLDAVRFVNDGFTIEYAPGLKRGETRNAIRVRNANGRLEERVIGDNEPLIAAGYRFYTTPNKGFALVFRWIPDDGMPVLGNVNLPSYPANEYRQANTWTIPGTRLEAWSELQFDVPPLDPDRATTFRKPERHAVVLRVNGDRHELRPRDRVRLPGGTLVYERLATWMGYNVFYDWTVPWLLAACLLAVASLAVHFWRRFAAEPWSAS